VAVTGEQKSSLWTTLAPEVLIRYLTPQSGCHPYGKWILENHLSRIDKVTEAARTGPSPATDAMIKENKVFVISQCRKYKVWLSSGGG
jgi:hypothetical protein